uniref:Ubiquitin carboxyl-terminal hydrolase 47 C-terminal domain-containing protein n=1 Tax=Amphimedon queenslandica TaxID=400682 RepID=A0A1X7UDW8_AMPQE
MKPLKNTMLEVAISVSMVDVSSGVVGPPQEKIAWLGWTVENLKQHIGEAYNLNSSCMRLVMEEEDYWSDTSVCDISGVGGTLKETLNMRGHSTLFYVSSDPEDYQKEFKDSLMYNCIEFQLKCIIIPPGLEPSTPTTINRREGRIVMKIISMEEENKEKERKVQVQVDKRITLAQLKEELVPLIGVPSTGFIVYRISGNEEYELKRLDEILMNISESKLIVKRRALRKGEYGITLYLLQVNSTEFCKFMMESIVAEGTLVREFKEQIIEEAKVQGIDCVLELDKMRLRKKNGMSPGRVYLDELIDTSGIREMYVEPLKGPEKMDYGQRQVYVIRWCPSQCSVDPIEEYILDKYHFPRDFIKKLSELSGVPAEYISYAEVKSFPVEISCLDIENKLTWYSINSDTYSLGLYDDGYVIYYKDNRETMKELTDKERSEIQEAKEKRQRKKKEQIEKEMCLIILYCNHPVSGKLKKSFLEVHKDELLPVVLDKAYELMKLAPHIPIERCRLVKYNNERHEMEQSFDLDEFQHLTIGRIMDLVGCYSLFLFLETRKENETFKEYNAGSIFLSLRVSVVDLSSGVVGPPQEMRAWLVWTVENLKQHIGEAYNLNSSCMRLVMREKDYWNDTFKIRDISDVGGTLKEILNMGGHNTSHTYLLYVSSNPEDYQKEFEDSLMNKCIEFHFNSILLDIIIPPGPEALPTTTIRRKGRVIMKIISMEDESKGEKRKVQVQVDKRITLAQLKEELVPLIGVPSAGFRVYGIIGNEEYELKRLDEILMNISESKLVVNLGRELQEAEYIVNLYLLQVNSIEFCKFMMESVYAEGTQVREFKKQIIEEAKVQGIDCVLELDKMRLRFKNRMTPGRVYLDHQLINTTNTIREMYVEPLKGPEKKKRYEQKQVYVIRWRPSQCSVDPIEEIILDDIYDTIHTKHFIRKLSELSGVPAKHISYSQGKSFPVEISCLDIENELTWYSDRYLVSGLNVDGYVIYYKDNKEKMKKLRDKERSEIQEAEEARLKRIREHITTCIH